MQELFSYGRKGIGEFLRQNLKFVLYTIIVHLFVFIVLTFMKVDKLKEAMELGVQVEFEELTVEDIIEQEEMEVPEDWLEQILAEREAASNRAVNVNAESRFNEDISTEDYVQDLLDQIEEARKEEDREKLEELQEILAASDYEPPKKEEGDDEQGEYTGPTTITYEFMEEPLKRGKVDLTVPVYRCQGSGIVRVEVSVDKYGNVSNARVKEPIEGTDRICFSEAALEAARSSRFRSDMQAPERHNAVITYAFVAQ